MQMLLLREGNQEGVPGEVQIIHLNCRLALSYGYDPDTGAWKWVHSAWWILLELSFGSLTIPNCNFNIKQQVALKDLPCCIYVLLNGWQLHKTIKQDASLIFAVKSTERSLTLFHRQKRDCFPYTCEYSSGSSFFQTEVYVSSLRKWIQTDFLRVDNGCDIAVLFPHH